MSRKHSTREDIRGRLRTYITAHFLVPGGEESLRDDTSLLEEGIMDSTGVLDLVAFIEESFSIRVEDEELMPENLDSVDRLVAFVEKKRGHAS